jgi:hypothetical protein
MATRAKAMRPQTAKQSLSNEIGVDLKPEMIIVDPHVAWVSSSRAEELIWIYLWPHDDGDDCFTVKFDGPNGSPACRRTRRSSTALKHARL